ncbi:hypothetical protein JCM30237_12200 [Halolamina litorea]|uniref:Uncharacterized protein n=1 Tax=Halolamina litorea TaxID=1515593 RepID=A0ABD6BPA1_9EURY|nr:hypothetical protein [Halolamina litorea]
MPEAVAAPVFLIISLYGALRFANFVDIWGEVDKAKTRIEYELATYLSDLFQPFNNEMSPDIDIDVSREDISELPDDGPLQSIDGDTVDWNSVFQQAGQNPLEIAGEWLTNVENLTNQGINPDSSQPVAAQYLVENEGLDPQEIFEEVHEVYSRYRSVKRSFFAARVALILFTVSSVGLIFASLFSVTLSSMMVYGYVSLVLLWIGLELYLWVVLNSEVEVSGRTPVDKLITEDLKDLI